MSALPNNWRGLGQVRYKVLLVIFIATALNYADRATLSLAGVSIAHDLHLDAAGMGYLFSAFGWAYVIGQLPSGWLLDRFGSRRVFLTALVIWAVLTSLQGAVWILGAAAVVALFVLRFLVGLAEAPCFPANSRIVLAWFPMRERGTASAIFNSAQYFSLVLFSPIMGWIVFQFGWHWLFPAIGATVVVVTLACARNIYSPRDHPHLPKAELAEIEAGGGLTTLHGGSRARGATWSHFRQMITNRMLVGIYLGQFGVNAVTYFFITWFPVYLVQARGMTILRAGFMASIPSVCGFVGGVLGGVVSDALLRRGFSLTVARKAPLVAGMLLATGVMACNWINTGWIVVLVMALAYFGKGFGALGWAVVSDTSPLGAAGLASGVFNFFGSTAAITTPIIIGYLVKQSGSFRGALVFVGANAALALVSYLLIVGEIKRVKLEN